VEVKWRKGETFRQSQIINPTFINIHSLTRVLLKLCAFFLFFIHPYHVHDCHNVNLVSFLHSQSDAFSSPKFKPTGTSIKTRGKIETIDDEQDPDLIPHYPRLTNIHQEELIPMNSDPSFLNRDRHKNATNDFLHDVEINFNGLLMNGKVPESCVWNLLYFILYFFNWKKLFSFVLFA